MKEPSKTGQVFIYGDIRKLIQSHFAGINVFDISPDYPIGEVEKKCRCCKSFSNKHSIPVKYLTPVTYD